LRRPSYGSARHPASSDPDSALIASARAATVRDPWVDDAYFATSLLPDAAGFGSGGVGAFVPAGGVR
jgi:hypothetical protein